MNAINGFGGIFMSHNGKKLYEKYLGNTKHTQFRIFSLSKPIVALAIIILVKNNLLKLNDTIDKFGINIPYSERITILFLLNHRSGIYDFVSELYFKHIPQKIYDKILSKYKTKLLQFDMYINEINKNKPCSTPNKKFKYNNTGYDILGYIIYIVTGIHTDTWIRKNIFRKLNMNESNFQFDNIKLESVPYKTNGKRGVKENYNWFGGNAFIISTLRDYDKFMSGYDKLLTMDTLNLYEKLYFFTKTKFGLTFTGHGARDFEINHHKYNELSLSFAIRYCNIGVNIILHQNKEAKYSILSPMMRNKIIPLLMNEYIK